ncbi:hypothetical protein CSB20_11515 [bacterium DOLZORAL124_64_63]|nr:MAG: hypothetical protein CSB20_11515 [bacterium DOLZORAL124_64_63]
MNVKTIREWIGKGQGLTLVEMMISLAVFGVVMGVVFGFMTGTRDNYDDTRAKVQAQQAVRAVISMMTSEIRSAGCDPTGAGFDRFVVAGDKTLRCRADLNGDGDTTDNSPDEDVLYTYSLGTAELLRNCNDGNGDLAILHHMRDVHFQYRDADGNILSPLPLNALDRASVRYVEIFVDGETDDGQPFDYRTSVMVRNG